MKTIKEKNLSNANETHLFIWIINISIIAYKKSTNNWNKQLVYILEYALYKLISNLIILHQIQLIVCLF